MKFLNQFIALILTTFIFSCAGQNSNPLEKYKGLKSAEPSQQSIETQTIVQPDLFDIQIDGTNQVNQGHFIEGQETQILLQVNPKSLQILKYKIELVDFSSVERPQLLSTSTTNVFALNWNPPIGIIPVGQWGKSFKAQLQVTVLEAQNKVLIGLVKISEFNLIVNRNNTQPQIIGRTDLKNGLKEGSTTNFTIDINDTAGVNNPRQPEIQITPYIYSNTEAYRADASHYLELDSSIKNNPEKIGPSQFRFHYKINIDRLPLDRDRNGNEIPNSTSVDICFLMRAVSAVGTLSEQLQICALATYVAQAPQFVFSEEDLKAIKSGVENVIHFNVQSEHPLSQVVLLNANQQIASLVGLKDIKCTYQTEDKKNELLCVFKWTPPCLKVNSLKNLNLKAETKINQTSRTSTITKELNILSNSEACSSNTKSIKGAQ